MTRSYYLAAILSMGTVFVPAQAAVPIKTADFQQLHTLIKPKKSEESWTQIPWLTNLWDARRQAAAEGKPLLLWEMDGHPLGCT